MANYAAPSASSPRPAPFALESAPGGGLVLKLTDRASYDVLRAAMRAELGATPGRYQGATVRIDLGRRDIDLFDLRRLIHLVKDEFGMDVVGLHCTVETLQRQAERELKIKVHVASAAPAPEPAPAPPPAPAPAPPALAGPDETPTEIVREAPAEADDEEPAGTGKVLTIPGTVRSGAVVRFAGDIQVFGDVNPGAQLIAGGNVLVFGALKGLAHAGARGDLSAVILAFDMRPTQLRIGKVIQLPSSPPEQVGRHVAPEIAWLSGNSIVIEPYRGRLPSGAALASKEST